MQGEKLFGSCVPVIRRRLADPAGRVVNEGYTIFACVLMCIERNGLSGDHAPDGGFGRWPNSNECESAGRASARPGALVVP